MTYRYESLCGEMASQNNQHKLILHYIHTMPNVTTAQQICDLYAHIICIKIFIETKNVPTLPSLATSEYALLTVATFQI